MKKKEETEKPLQMVNLRFEENEIGGTIKSSKTQMIWEFDLDGNHFKVELDDSKWSGRKRISVNGKMICDETDKGNFFKNFQLCEHNCTIIQYGEKNEFRIDNQSFMHLYDLEKNKRFFSATNQTPVVHNIQTKAEDRSVNMNFNIANTLYKKDPKEKEPQQLFSFKIKKNEGENPNKFAKKFEFGKINMVQPNQTNIQRPAQSNNNIIDIFGNDSQSSNTTGNINQPQNNTNTGVNMNTTNTNTSNTVNNQPQSGNDLFDIFGSSSTTTNPPMSNNTTAPSNTSNNMMMDFNFNMTGNTNTTTQPNTSNNTANDLFGISMGQNQPQQSMPNNTNNNLNTNQSSGNTLFDLMGNTFGQNTSAQNNMTNTNQSSYNPFDSLPDSTQNNQNQSSNENPLMGINFNFTAGGNTSNSNLTPEEQKKAGNEILDLFS
ncbi:MAG: hypothetical protein MJ252_12540 [archaeon]|nr:hypothetical protein [archaeon]